MPLPVVPSVLRYALDSAFPLRATLLSGLTLFGIAWLFGIAHTWPVQLVLGLALTTYPLAVLLSAVFCLRMAPTSEQRGKLYALL